MQSYISGLRCSASSSNYNLVNASEQLYDSGRRADEDQKSIIPSGATTVALRS